MSRSSQKKKETSSLKTDEIEATRWQVPQNEQQVSQALSDGNSEVEEKKVVIPAKRSGVRQSTRNLLMLKRLRKNVRNVPRKRVS